MTETNEKNDVIISSLTNLTNVIEKLGKPNIGTFFTAGWMCLFAALAFFIPYFLLGRAHQYKVNNGSDSDSILQSVREDVDYNEVKMEYYLLFYPPVLKEVTISIPDLRDRDTLNRLVADVTVNMYGIQDPPTLYDRMNCRFNPPNFEDRREGTPWNRIINTSIIPLINRPNNSAFQLARYLELPNQINIPKRRINLLECRFINKRYAIPFNASQYFWASLKVNGEFTVVNNGTFIKSWSPWGNMDFYEQDLNLIASFKPCPIDDLDRAGGMLPCKVLVLYAPRDNQLTLGDINSTTLLLEALLIRMFPRHLNLLVSIVEKALHRAIPPDELQRCFANSSGIQQTDERFKQWMRNLYDGLVGFRGEIVPPFPTEPVALRNEFSSIEVVRNNIPLNEEQQRVRMWLANLTLVSRRLNCIPIEVLNLRIPDTTNAWLI